MEILDIALFVFVRERVDVERVGRRRASSSTRSRAGRDAGGAARGTPCARGRLSHEIRRLQDDFALRRVEQRGDAARQRLVGAVRRIERLVRRVGEVVDLGPRAARCRRSVRRSTRVVGLRRQRRRRARAASSSAAPTVPAPRRARRDTRRLTSFSRAIVRVRSCDQNASNDAHLAAGHRAGHEHVAVAVVEFLVPVEIAVLVVAPAGDAGLRRRSAAACCACAG